MVDRHGNDATDEPEVLDVVFIKYARVWIYLEGIIVASRKDICAIRSYERNRSDRPSSASSVRINTEREKP